MRRGSGLFKFTYLLNFLAVAVFIASFFFEGLYTEKGTGTQKSVIRYSIFDAISYDGNIGLIAISMGAIVIALALAGLIIWHKNKALSQSFITCSIVYSYIRIISLYTKINGETGYSATKYDGYTLAMVSTIIVGIATLFFTLASSREAKSEY